MLARNLLLITGVLALLGGAVLSVAWLRQSQRINAQPEPPPVVMQVVLVASRPLPAGTLLRNEDFKWESVPLGDVSGTSMVRGRVAEAELIGSATRRAFRAGEQLVASDLVKPTDRGFLVVALAPGYRAVSVSVDAAQSTSGLVMPGDRVDVILTQSFNVKNAEQQQMKTVGETVLHDLRVIAVDQTFNMNTKPAEPRLGANMSEFRVPKTVTLEVTEQQAQVLLVADQIGKIQLALRGVASAPAATGDGAKTAPTWASDVSPALRRLGNAEQAPAPAGGHVIDVIRGSKLEQRCVSSNGLVPCK